jgi:hypothetical protein
MQRVWILVIILFAVLLLGRPFSERFCNAPNFRSCKPLGCMWHMPPGGQPGHCEQSPYQWYC